MVKIVNDKVKRLMKILLGLLVLYVTLGIVLNHIVCSTSRFSESDLIIEYY